MIVKNEAVNLPRLFESIYPYIDFFVISDTGSTDDTIQVIHKLATKYNLPGVVESHYWVDFATNRNIALNMATELKRTGIHQCKWLMFIDADEILVVKDKNWKNTLIEGNNYTWYKRTNGYLVKLNHLVSIKDKGWKWEGKIHGNLKNDFLKKNYIHLTGVSVNADLMFTGAKSAPFKNIYEKLGKDIELLETELQQTSIKKSNVHRYFQLAGGYMGLKFYKEAAKNYNLIIGFSETIKDIKYQALTDLSWCYLNQKESFNNCINPLMNAIFLNPERKESYYYLANIYRQYGWFYFSKLILEKANSIFIEEFDYYSLEIAIYEWMIKRDLAFIYFLLGQNEKSKLVINELLKNKSVPEKEILFLKELLTKH